MFYQRVVVKLAQTAFGGTFDWQSCHEVKRKDWDDNKEVSDNNWVPNMTHTVLVDEALSLSLCLRGLSPQANYTDRTAAAGRRS